MKAFAEYNDYDIVGEYEDAGKSGKSIEGCMQFNQMMKDVMINMEVDTSAIDQEIETFQKKLRSAIGTKGKLMEERRINVSFWSRLLKKCRYIQKNRQWLKSIKFKLPIIEEDISLSLDNDGHMEKSA